MYELSEKDLEIALGKSYHQLARHEAIALLIRKEKQLDDNLELYRLGQSVKRAAGRDFSAADLRAFDDLLEGVE